MNEEMTRGVRKGLVSQQLKSIYRDLRVSQIPPSRIDVGKAYVQEYLKNSYMVDKENSLTSQVYTGDNYGDTYVESFSKTTNPVSYVKLSEVQDIIEANNELVKTTQKQYEKTLSATDGGLLAVNRRRIQNEYHKFATEMTNRLEGVVVISGEYYAFEDYFYDQYYKKDEILSIDLLDHFFKNIYGKDNRLIKAVLHLISHYRYEDLGTRFVWQVNACLYADKSDKAVRKFALKVFDNWNNNEAIAILQGGEPLREAFLENYRKKIVSRIEENL